MTSNLWRTVACVAVVALLAAALGPSAARAASHRTPEVKAPQASAGMQVAIDEKGRIRQPTREEAQALVAAVEQLFHNRSSEAIVTQYADGMISAVVGEGFDNVYLARIQADGSIASACVDDAGAAARFLTSDAALEEK